MNYTLNNTYCTCIGGNGISVSSCPLHSSGRINVPFIQTVQGPASIINPLLEFVKYLSANNIDEINFNMAGYTVSIKAVGK